MFCSYKDIFGKPKQGVHSIRFLDVAILDVIGTLLIAWVLQYFLGGNYFMILLLLMILAIFLHRLFCVDTTLDRLIQKLGVK